MHGSLEASVFSSKTGDGRGWAAGGCWGRDKVLDFCSSGWGLGSAVWEDFVTTGGHRRHPGMQGRGRHHPARDQRGYLGETLSKSNMRLTPAPLTTSFALPTNRPGSRSRQTSGLAVALSRSQERPVPEALLYLVSSRLTFKPKPFVPLLDRSPGSSLHSRALGKRLGHYGKGRVKVGPEGPWDQCHLPGDPSPHRLCGQVAGDTGLRARRSLPGHQRCHCLPLSHLASVSSTAEYS